MSMQGKESVTGLKLHLSMVNLRTITWCYNKVDGTLWYEQWIQLWTTRQSPMKVNNATASLRQAAGLKSLLWRYIGNDKVEILDSHFYVVKQVFIKFGSLLSVWKSVNLVKQLHTIPLCKVLFRKIFFPLI